ncbi:MAG: hypothetical protein RIK87_10770 [Fuerstiella sp.]
MTLPDDLRESLAEEDFAAVETWWESLTSEQQNDLSGDSDSKLEKYSPLPIPDEPDPDDELFPFYDYLINHEFRLVNFVAEPEAKLSYRIVSSYLASLGSDYRHGQSGTVQ